MKSNRRRTTSVAVSIILGTVLSTSALPSYAAPIPDPIDEVADTVQSLQSIPEAGPIADAETFAVQEDGSLTHTTSGSELTVEAGPTPIVELDSDLYEPLRIASALPNTAEFAEDGTAVFTSDENYAVTPLPHDDGSVQIITVLEDSTAPERFDYDLSSSTPVTLNIQDNGMVVILNDAGGFVGGIAVPWAFDANGAEVPTHFEVNGTTLTQIVDHRSGNFTYPISADPYGGQNLWLLSSIDSFSGDTRVNLTLSSWGNGNALPWILIDYGWPEALNRSNALRSALTSKATMRQQYDCHAFGSAFAGPWNLERFRPDRTVVWSYGVAVHHCNWTTPNQY